MVKFEFQDKQYSLSSWADVKLSTFIDYIERLYPNQPEPIKNILAADTNAAMNVVRNNWTSQEELEALFFMTEMVALFFDIPVDKLKVAMTRAVVEMAYWGIESILSSMPEDPNFTGFEIDGVEYLLPSKFMQDSTFIEFAEAAQYQQNLI